MLSIFSFASASFFASFWIPCGAVVCRIDHDHRQRNAACIHKLLPVVVVEVFNFSVADSDLAAVLVLKFSDREVLARLFAQTFPSSQFCALRLFSKSSSVMPLCCFCCGDDAIDLILGGE